MNEAYVFQNSKNGIQIFVYHALDLDDAKRMFESSVISYWDWQYLGKKIAANV